MHGHQVEHVTRRAWDGMGLRNPREMVQNNVEAAVPGERGLDPRPGVIWAGRIESTAAVLKGVHAGTVDPGVRVAAGELVAAAVAARGWAVDEDGVVFALRTWIKPKSRDVNRAQHRIASTNQHSARMATK